MPVWFLKVRNKIREIPGPERMMIGASLVAVIIAAVMMLLTLIEGLEHL
jgi:hypothetical protein